MCEGQDNKCRVSIISKVIEGVQRGLTTFLGFYLDDGEVRINRTKQIAKYIIFCNPEVFQTIFLQISGCTFFSKTETKNETEIMKFNLYG